MTIDILSSPKILIIGDVMVDKYLWGDSTRVSPEAPVPVVHVTRESETLGGAGNVAANVMALGGAPTIATILGDDANGDLALSLIVKNSADQPLLVREPGRPVTVKTRVIAAKQQVVRFDVETRVEASTASINRFAELLEDSLGDFQAVCISDYGKGVLTNDLLRRVLTICRAAQIPVIVDPKGNDVSKYHGATLLTPNRKEASEITGIEISDRASLLLAGKKLLQLADLGHVLITLGEDGMALFHGDHFDHVPTFAREVFDVTGAGDTVVGALAVALASGHDMMEACRFANLAAGVVVAKVGAATATTAEMRQLSPEWGAAPLVAEKVTTLPELLKIQAQTQQRGKWVFTNGCFDVLHAGHVQYLEQAARLGKKLIVGLNSDQSVRRLKGTNRPINTQAHRALVLSALEFVDHVVIFEEDTPLALIEALVPDVLVKGGDYNVETIVGAETVTKNGGLVTTVPLVAGLSSTKTLQNLRGTES